jgi:serine/threonine protein phosphatase PrpC
MEDAHVCRMLDAMLFPDTAVFAVLDGHGGGDVSKVLSWLLIQEMEHTGRQCLQAHRKVNLREVLTTCLPRLDEKLNIGPYGLGRYLPPVMHPFLLMGSTGCIAAVDFSKREIVAANVGDSRAMLIRDGRAIELTEDHKPEDPGERSRILDAGGRVLKMGPCHRVDGSLNLSRAFGDFALKANRDLPYDRQKVIAVPDITHTPFEDGDLLLVGCDGLFERCNWQDVADIVSSGLDKGMELAQAAQELLHTCCASRIGEEGTDNETVILVRLPPNHSPIVV